MIRCRRSRRETAADGILCCVFSDSLKFLSFSLQGAVSVRLCGISEVYGITPGKDDSSREEICVSDSFVPDTAGSILFSIRMYLRSSRSPVLF